MNNIKQLNPFGEPYPHQVIILGNGFDLQCGLESSYKQFFNSNYADKSNLFLKLATNENYDWSDIEKLIENVIGVISLFTDGMLNKISTSNTDGHFNGYSTRQPKSILMSKSEYHELEKQIAINLWKLKVTNQLELSNHTLQISDIYNYLKMQLSDFENNFKSYLNSCLEGSSEEYQANSRVLAEILEDTNIEHSDNKELYTRWFSFNYTKPDTIKDALSNVHGCVDSDIIFGVDAHGTNGENQEKSKSHNGFMEFTKTYRLLYRRPKSLSQGIPDNIKYIKFYGHSLGEADYSYFQSIFDSAQIYEKSVRLYFYFTEFDENNEDKQRTELSEKVFKLIRTYGETMTNKDHGKNLLHKLIIEGRLFLEVIANITDDVV